MSTGVVHRKARRRPGGVGDRRRSGALALVLLLTTPPVPSLAQAPGQAPPGAIPAAPAPAAAGPAGEPAAPKLPPEQLDALVAPIALYPDPLLSQALMAATYPLEIVQAQQWAAKNQKLKGDELEKAVKAQPWEAAVQATVMVPDLLKRLAEDITWTTNLGNAFLAQQQDVMDAVQRLRKKAKDSGKLESNDKMKVETKVVEKQTVVVIESASPQVVYVPAYNPTVVWGPPPYPYPPVYYPPPPPPGAMLFTFSMGVMMGAAMHGGYCCGCSWGHGGNTVVINNNNNFVSHHNTVNNVRPGSSNSNWQHNPQHRGGAPYGDRATAAKYGGGGRGGAGTMDRGGAGGGRGGGPSAGAMDRGGAGGGRGGGPSAGAMDRAGPGGGGASAGAMDRGGGGRGGDIGGRTAGPSAGGSAFGGAGGGADRAQASSSRGASSMGGGGRGGGGRGGGGGRRR